MSEALQFSEYVELMSDILPLLNARGLWWKRCSGPPANTTGITADELLPLLVNVDPIWDADLLNTVLRNGLQLGTLKQSPPGFYYGNANMLGENGYNKVFLNVIPDLCAPVKGFTRQPFVIY